MSAYPAGTVTFLFTDIEGSIELLQKLGDDHATVVADHRLRAEGSHSDFGDRISRHVESIVEAQLEAVFAGGKSPPTGKLAGLTAVGIGTLVAFLGVLVGIGLRIKVALF